MNFEYLLDENYSYELILRKMITDSVVSQFSLIPPHIKFYGNFYAIFEAVAIFIVSKKDKNIIENLIKIVFKKYFKEIFVRYPKCSSDMIVRKDGNQRDMYNLHVKPYLVALTSLCKNFLESFQIQHEKQHESIQPEMINEDQTKSSIYSFNSFEAEALIPDSLLSLTLQELGFSFDDFERDVLKVFHEIAHIMTTNSLNFAALCAKKRKTEIKAKDLAAYFAMIYGIYVPGFLL